MKPAASTRAFTLIEVMVSMAVLAVLVMLAAQLMSGATKTSTLGSQRLDADGQARLVFDRMADDFAHMVSRPDMDFVFKKNAGNDEAFFFSDAPAIAPAAGAARPLALVGYRVKDNKLERMGYGLNWDQKPPAGAVHLTFQSNSQTAVAESTIMGSGFREIIEGSDSAYHVLGEGVFRLEFSFLLKPSEAEASKLSPTPFRGDGSTDNAKGRGLADVQAIVVTLGILDEKSKLLLDQDPTKLEGAATSFVDASDNQAQGVAPLWQEATSRQTLPAAAAQQLRVYQRMFPVRFSQSATR